MDKRFKIISLQNKWHQRLFANRVLPLCLLLCLVPRLCASVLSEAQKDYDTGNIAEALEQFQQVQYKDPNEVTLLYNQANCHFKLDETDLAAELFQKVLAQSSDPSLQAKAHFNLGNCFFRQAAAQPDKKNRQDVLKKWQSAVKHYRQTLMLNPDDAEAKHNIALARHLMGQIIAQIQQQEKQQKKDQEKKEDLAEKIRQLLKRQNDLISNASIIQQAQQSDIADPNAMIRQRQQISSSQSRLKEDTSAVQNEAQQTLDQQQQDASPTDITSPQNNAPASPSVYETVNNEMIFAVDHQDQAVDDLDQSKMPDAVVRQSEAAQHLQNALDALKQDQEKNQQQQQKDQEKKKNSENKQDESKQKNNEKQDSQDKDQQEQQPQSKQDQQNQPEQGQDKNQNDQEAKPLDMTAQKILDKEKERNKKKRKVILRGGKGVEKNW